MSNRGKIYSFGKKSVTLKKNTKTSKDALTNCIVDLVIQGAMLEDYYADKGDDV